MYCKWVVNCDRSVLITFYNYFLTLLLSFRCWGSIRIYKVYKMGARLCYMSPSICLWRYCGKTMIVIVYSILLLSSLIFYSCSVQCQLFWWSAPTPHNQVCNATVGNKWSCCIYIYSCEFLKLNSPIYCNYIAVYIKQANFVKGNKDQIHGYKKLFAFTFEKIVSATNILWF